MGANAVALACGGLFMCFLLLVAALWDSSSQACAVTYVIFKLLLGRWLLCRMRLLCSGVCFAVSLAVLPSFVSRFAQVVGGDTYVKCAGCSGFQCPEGHLKKKVIK